MDRTQDKDSRLSAETKWGELVFVETFSKANVSSVSSRFSAFLGVEPNVSPVQMGGQPESGKMYSWKPSDLNKAFESVLSVSETPTSRWGGSHELFARMISGIEAEALDSEELPFFLLVLRVTLSQKAISESVGLEEDIRRVRNPIRYYLESLRGHSKEGVSFSPAVPAFTLLSLKVDQRLLTSLQREAIQLADHSASHRTSKEAVIEHRKLDAFNLSLNKEPDVWSHFALATNLSVIVAHADPLGILGIRSPYMLVLSPEEGLLHFNQPTIPAVALVMGAPMLVSWSLPNMFVVPLALLAWSGAFWTELRTHEKAVNQISTIILSDGDYQVDMKKLDELTKIGIRMASLDIQVGFLERMFGQTIEAWSKNSVSYQRELGMPSMSSWPYSSREGTEGGFLSYLGKWLRTDLDAMTRAIRGLQRQVELLSGQANDAIVRKSTFEMDKATVASEKSQRLVSTMTFVLVVLTSTLVTLALLENGYLSYALVGAAITLALAVAELAKELPKFRYLLVELVVVVVAFQLWPSDWPWYVIALLCAGIVGFTSWLLLRNMIRNALVK